MNIGEIVTFPMSSRTYIFNLISYRIKEKDPKKKWKIDSYGDDDTFNLIRTT